MSSVLHEAEVSCFLSVFNLQLSFPSGVLLGTHLFLLSLGLPLLNNIPLNSCTLACMLLWLPTLPLLMTPSCFFISTHVSHLLFSTFLSHTYFLQVVHLFMFSPLYLSLDSPPSSVHHLQSFQPSPSVSPSLEAPPPAPPSHSPSVEMLCIDLLSNGVEGQRFTNKAQRHTGSTS